MNVVPHILSSFGTSLIRHSLNVAQEKLGYSVGRLLYHSENHPSLPPPHQILIAHPLLILLSQSSFPEILSAFLPLHMLWLFSLLISNHIISQPRPHHASHSTHPSPPHSYSPHSSPPLSSSTALHQHPSKSPPS